MADRRDPPAREALLRRIGGEFTEMPCLRLTRPQAQRLFGLRTDICERILTALVQQRLLVCDSNGRYRLNDSHVGPARSGIEPSPPEDTFLAYHSV
jgi:hypothetical protein